MDTERRESEPNRMPKKIFIYFGPPTSGKTTQTIFLQETLRAEKVNARDIVPGASEEFESSRDVIPDEVFIPALRQKLSSLSSGIVIFDNLPRTLLQANSLVDWCTDNNIELHAVRLTLTEEQVLNRAAGRQICVTCGESYHPDLKPSKEPNRCDHDDTELIKKKGDKPDIVKKGVQEYFIRESEILDAVQKGGIIHQISAEGTVYDTSRRMFAELSPAIFADPKMGDKYFQFRDHLEELDIPHIFISGMPVFVYGGRTLMKDFDILVPDEKIEVISGEMHLPVEDLNSSVANTRYMEVSDGIEVVSNLEVTTDGQSTPFDFNFLLAGSKTVRFMGMPCTLMGVEDLILFKCALGRFGEDDFGKMKDDLSDVQGLVGVQNINWTILRQRAQQLKMEERLVKKLSQINVIPPWLSKDGKQVNNFY
jgi:adenylate kinase